MRASNAGGDSDYSNEASGATAETVPASPTNLTANAVSSSQITLGWTDNSDNESGFKIERCTGSPCGDSFASIATVGAGVTSYSNNSGLSPSTTYTYRVRAFNGAGDSLPSNDASATTSAAASMTLSVTGRKVTGLQKADLVWSGATSTNVDVFRDGAKITTTANDGAHTDNIDRRGSGSYTYKVCEAGTTACSNEATVTF